MLEDVRKRLKEFDDEGLDGDDVVRLYSGGSTPRYGEITSDEDMYIALRQRISCRSCSKCYWGNDNGGGCSHANIIEEILRVMQISEEKKVHSIRKCTCAECVYASSTNPRICMNPDSIAKHSYVKDDSYCDKGEPLCVI